MKYLDYITGIINEAVAHALPCERAQILGVAQLVRRKEMDGKKPIHWPAVYIGKGELQYAGFDDKYSLCTYHRALNMSVSRAPGPSYGDNVGNMLLSHRMSLVMYANREEIHMNADQLALLMQFAIPEQLTKSQLPQDFARTNINITDVVLNEQQVFNEEFLNVEPFLGPEHVLLKCNYTIESTLNKRCFNTQCQPEG